MAGYVFQLLCFVDAVVFEAATRRRDGASFSRDEWRRGRWGGCAEVVQQWIAEEGLVCCQYVDALLAG